MKKYLMLFPVMFMLLFVSRVFAVPIADINYLEKDLGNGRWEYAYSFNNNSDNNEYLSGVTLYFDPVLEITGSPLPAGWFDLLWEGINTTNFLQTISEDMSYDIASGNYLNGFKFEANYRLSDIGFEAYFDDHGGNIFQTSGKSVLINEPANVSVPEPSSIILLLSFGIPLFFKKNRQENDF